MACLRFTLFLALASTVLAAPLDVNLAPNQALLAKTNSNGTSTVLVAPAATIKTVNDVTASQTMMHDMQAHPAAKIQARNDMDDGYSAQGRDNSLNDALGLMSSVLSPKFMQPGAGGSAPSAPAVPQQQQHLPQQQQQMMGGFPQQQQPMGAFNQQQPFVGQQFPQQGFNQQQPAAYLPPQQVQPGMMDTRMMPMGGMGQLGYGGQGMMGAYPTANGMVGQGLPYAQMRSLPNNNNVMVALPQQQTMQNGFAGQQQPIQQQGNGQFQSAVPTFNGNQQAFNPQG